MATAEIILDKRREKRKGTYPIKMRLISARKSVYISIGYEVEEKDWNDRAGKVKPSHPRHTQINNKILRYDSAAWAVIGDMEKIHNKIEVRELKKSVLHRLSPTFEEGDFIAYCKDQIEFQRKYGKIGTSIWYRTSINALINFLGEDRLAYHQFDIRMVRSFENWMQMRKLSTNARSSYHRALRAIFNKAITEEQVSGIDNPYKKFKIKSENTAKRAIKVEQLKAIMELEFDKNSILELHRDIFLFSFYTRGTNVRDIIQLRNQNIRAGRMIYKRAKTDKMFDVKLTKEATDIIAKYSVSKDPESLLFPILHGKDLDEPESAYNAFKQASKIHNDYLKEVAKKAGIETKLTSYVARHSWATIAKRNNVSSAIIRDSLGHQSISTTETYLQALGNEELDDINEKITRL